MPLIRSSRAISQAIGCEFSHMSNLLSDVFYGDSADTEDPESKHSKQDVSQDVK